MKTLKSHKKLTRAQLIDCAYAASGGKATKDIVQKLCVLERSPMGQLCPEFEEEMRIAKEEILFWMMETKAVKKQIAAELEALAEATQSSKTIPQRVKWEIIMRRLSSWGHEPSAKMRGLFLGT